MITTKLDQKIDTAVFDCCLFNSGSRLISLFSDGTVTLYDIISRKRKEIVSDAKVNSISVNENAVLAAVSENGFLSVYSVKGMDVELIFTDKLQIENYHTTSVVINQTGTFLAVAIDSFKSSTTDNKYSDEEDENGPRILFYDIRKKCARPLGCYKESHSSEINCLKFSPVVNNYLLSAGSDGLVNVFDLRQNNEDDALIQTFNCECSVSRSNFYGEKLLKLYAVTDDNSLCGWTVEEGDEVFAIKNAHLNESSVLVDCFIRQEEEMFQVFSQVDGTVTIGKLESEKKIKLVDSGAVHSDMARCASWCKDTLILAIGADDGSVYLNQIEFDKTYSSNVKRNREKKKK